MKLEKRKNIIGGIIMYAIMLLTYLITMISYLVTIFRSYATAYTWVYFVEDFLLILGIIAALVIMIVRKRQSGFGVASPMLVSLISEIAFLIALAIQNASTYYRVHPNWTTYLTFLLIIPAVIVIIFFFVPNKPMQIVSASVVIVSFLTEFTVRTIEIFTAINRGYFNGRYAFSLIFSIMTMFVLYALIIVQIFASFKKAGAPAVNAYANAGYNEGGALSMSENKYPKLPDLGTRTDEIEIYAGPCSVESEEQFNEKKKELFGEDGQE